MNSELWCTKKDSLTEEDTSTKPPNTEKRALEKSREKMRDAKWCNTMIQDPFSSWDEHYSELVDFYHTHGHYSMRGNSGHP